MKKVLIIEHYFLTPHFETSIEIAIDNKIEGNNVVYVYLRQFYSTLLIPYHLKLSILKNYFFLKNKETSILSTLKIMSNKFKINIELKYNKKISIFFKALKFAVFHPLTIEILSEYKYKNINLGLSSLSTYISNIGNDQPIISFRSLRLKKILFESVIAFELTQDLINNHNPDFIYVFNGRFNIDNAVVKCCLINKIPFKLHERGCNIYKYEVYEWPLHSYFNINKKIQEYFDSRTVKKNEYERLACSFFEKNRNGEDLNWVSFNAHFKKSNIKKTSKTKYVYFSSSDDEFSSIEYLPQDKQPIFNNQRNCIEFLINYFSVQKNKELVIRVHPHKEKKSNELKKFWNNLQGDNISVIHSSSLIDSYQLIEESDIILSFGSTIGIEATYWGKPSILLGSSSYMYLECIYNPKNENELNKLLNIDYLLPFSRESTFKYGYYMMTYGKDFKYYKPKNFFEGDLDI